MNPRDMFEEARLLLQFCVAGKVFFSADRQAGGNMVLLYVLILVVGFVALVKGADVFDI